MRVRRVGTAAALLGLAACELTEVTVPTGVPTVVVHAVLRPDRNRQFVLVEEALTGAADDPLPAAGSPRGSRRGIDGALVTLEVASGGTCGARIDTVPAATDARGLYELQGMCLAAGDVVTLRVVVPDGRTVQGRTRVPGVHDVTLTVGGEASPGVGDVDVHRGQDDLRIGVDAVFARGIQVEVRRPEPQPVGPFVSQNELVFFLISDSLGMRIPADLVNPFEGDSGEVVFRAGLIYNLTVAAADTSYYDFVRSRTDPFTGRGFINRLEGGIGVFGALDSRSWRLRIVDDVDDPREGLYRVQGDLGGVPVDLTAELYVDRLARGGFAAFIDGQWFDGPVRRSLEGRFAEREGDPDRFVAGFQVEVLVDTVLVSRPWGLRGRRGPIGQPFAIEVLGPPPEGLIDTLTAVQVSGPGG